MKENIFSSFSALAALGFSAVFANSITAQAPNVVFVFADELRACDLGFKGNDDVITPNIDRLASQSVVFSNAISVCPVSSPYRGSMLTGRYPLNTGVFVNDVLLDPETLTMPKIFSASGYETAYIGKWHLDGHGRSSLIPEERRHGFDYWKVLECTHDYYNSYYWDSNDEKRKWEGYDAYAQTDDAAGYISSRKGNSKPFLLFLSWGPPHTPFNKAPEHLKKIYREKELKIRANVPEEMKKSALNDLIGYYAHITALDSCIGVLQQAIADAGFEENTIFIFTSDHGAMIRSHGYNNKQRPYEESIRVPLLVKYPAVLGNKGRNTDMLIGTPDLMPTILGLCRLPVPSSAEGDDKSAVVTGRSKDRTNAVLVACYHPFGQYTRNIGGKEFRGVRTKQYTYVRDLKGPWLLFDNLRDPYQMTNLVNDPSTSKIRKRLERDLSNLLVKTDDEFLNGEEYIKKWGYTIDETGTVPYTR
ncbi:MAG: sulfatase [Bacteroidales bacterium]|nr:sulfatase [Bacteroidales bacterium]MBN2634570.1 sulfatase [Bacteroidales bacterium]